MHIAVFILKIILLALCILLLLLLCLLLLLLLVPLRYRVDATMQDKPEVQVKLSWMAFFVRMRAHYKEGALQYTLRSFGVLLASDTGQSKKSTETRAFDEKEFEAFMKETEPDAEDLPVIDTSAMEQWMLVEPKASVWEVIVSFWRGFCFLVTLPARAVVGVIRGLTHLLHAIGELEALRSGARRQLQRINRQSEMLLRLWSVQTTKTAWKHARQALVRLLSLLRPDTLTGNLLLGCTDPAMTGQIFGILGLLLPLYYDKISLTADFERAVLQGELHMKGRVRIGSVLRLAVQIYFDKYIRVTYKRCKRILGGQNHGK